MEIYVNGILASTESGFTSSYVPLDIRPARAGAAQARREGSWSPCIAIRPTGGQNIDVGLVNVEDAKKLSDDFPGRES